MNDSRFKSGIVATILVGILLPVAGSVFVHMVLPGSNWVQVPLHSAVEALGALAALSLAVFSLMLWKYRQDFAPSVWISCGLIGMGILDGLHASVSPGNSFVWLRSAATLIGGFLFALVWLPERITRSKAAEALPALVAVTAGIFGTLSIVFSDALPTMISQGVFTSAAKSVNILGGLFFLLAAIRFIIHHRANGSYDELLFANLSLFFGFSGLLFQFSSPWEADWWFWHFLRLTAYIVALWYVFATYQRTMKDLKQEVGERKKAEEALQRAHEELEKKVQESTAGLRAASLYTRSLIEASLDPLVTISKEGKITDVNKATEQVTEVTRERLIGSDFSDYFTEPEKAREGYQQVFSRGFVRDYPLAIRHSSGKVIDVLYNAVVYKNEAGEVQGVFAAARDVTESKRIMREFAETKSFLDNILQSSTKYSIIGKDPNHRILSWNEGARLNYGYTADEVIGKESGILHTPEDIKSGAVDKLLKMAYEKGLAEGEFQRVRKDGSRFVASVVVTRRNDVSGRPIGYLLMSSDITEKKQADEKLRIASLYTRSLIEASLDPLVTISKDGKINDVNKATEQVTGVTRERLIGSDFSDYFTEPEKAREGYQQVFSRGFVRDYPLAIRHSSGKVIDVLYNAVVYKNEAGDVLGVFAAARDVTERKVAEEKLRAASFYSRGLIEASLDPLVTISKEGKITDVNKATEQVTGVPRERLVGSDFSDYFTEPEKAREGYREVFSKGFVRDYPLAIRHASGKVIDVFYNAVVYRNEAGEVQGVFAAARDIPEHKKMKEKLKAQALEIMEAVNVLSTSTSEILVSTTQLASTASETATALSETSSTAEELKQTAQLSNEKARNVSQSSQKATSVAQEGKTAVAENMEAINRIKGQAELVAESIVKLSEQAQAIGEITTSVNDLAEQSNLLAVNAAIEAAKAGEQGKGFAVVAQEIRSLAEQSKHATAQVRSILTDVQKATSATVMATEQASKAVEAGVKQAAVAGESIRNLAEIIVEASQVATQVSASSQQQLVGIDQIASAMENIKQAAQQNVAGAKQAEKAAHDLNELGQKLKAMVEESKV